MMNVMQLETQMELLVQVLLVGICKGIIDHERKSRSREAGIRTHLIVVNGAASIMVVSRYGFSNIPGDEDIALNLSRVAAQIVTGVGLLGAGMIFIRKSAISGLTTAIGIWVTSAIGMMIGNGLYTLGVLTVVLTVFVQIILRRNHHWLRGSHKEELPFVIDRNREALQDLRERLKHIQVGILNVSLTQEHSCYQANLVITLPGTYQAARLLDMSHDVVYIYEIDV